MKVTNTIVACRLLHSRHTQERQRGREELHCKIQQVVRLTVTMLPNVPALAIVSARRRDRSSRTTFAPSATSGKKLAKAKANLARLLPASARARPLALTLLSLLTPRSLCARSAVRRYLNLSGRRRGCPRVRECERGLPTSRSFRRLKRDETPLFATPRLSVIRA